MKATVIRGNSRISRPHKMQYVVSSDCAADQYFFVEESAEGDPLAFAVRGADQNAIKNQVALCSTIYPQSCTGKYQSRSNSQLTCENHTRVYIRMSKHPKIIFRRELIDLFPFSNVECTGPPLRLVDKSNGLRLTMICEDDILRPIMLAGLSYFLLRLCNGL